MFTGIRDKILNVRKNVSLFTSDDTATKSKETPIINQYAGAKLLDHFQNQWVEIHNSNEENARAAENVATEINNISEKITTSKKNIDLITHVLTNSNLISNITQCLNQVKELYGVSESLERKLVHLEDLLDQAEFEKMTKQHRFHLDNYKERKQETLNKLSSTLEEEYKKKVEQHDNKKKLILEERQKVFQEAFKSDIEVYKSLGTIPKLEIPKNQNGALLEEIQLDFDQNELEKFFNDENGGNS